MKHRLQAHLQCIHSSCLVHSSSNDNTSCCSSEPLHTWVNANSLNHGQSSVIRHVVQNTCNCTTRIQQAFFLGRLIQPMIYTLISRVGRATANQTPLHLTAGTVLDTVLPWCTGSIEVSGSPVSPADSISHTRLQRSVSHLSGQSFLRDMPTEGLASSLVSHRPPQLPKSASFMQVRPTPQPGRCVRSASLLQP